MCDNCSCGEPPYAGVEPGANGPKDVNEEAVLREEFGEPNQDGIYGAVIEE